MQHKLIALAVAGLVSTSAIAQSNVTIYGVLDYGYAYRFDARSLTKSGPTPNSASQLNGGQAFSNRIGFKGTEDIGNGLKALFVLEQGYNLDANDQLGSAGFTFTRQSYVGLSGNFGSVIGGRMYTPYYNFVAGLDPFVNGTVGRYSNAFILAPTVTGSSLTNPLRFDNAIAYTSPTFGGFSVTGAFSNNVVGQDATTSNAANNTAYALFGQYAAGPIYVGANYHYIASGSNSVDSLIDNVQNFSLGGSYDFNVTKFMALWTWNEIEYAGSMSNVSNATVNNYMLGATVPFGKWAGKATYVYSNGNRTAGGDAQQFAVGLDYNLSKRSTIYTAYSYINNSDNRMSATGDAGQGGGYAAGNGFGAGVWQQGLQVGFTHRF